MFQGLNSRMTGGCVETSKASNRSCFYTVIGSTKPFENLQSHFHFLRTDCGIPLRSGAPQTVA